MTAQTELKVEDIKAASEEKGCPVQKALYYVSGFLSGPMCGRCMPCSMGSYEAVARLSKIVAGEGVKADLDALRRIALEMSEASMCKKGKDTAKFIQEWLDTGVYDEHISGRCPDNKCLAFIEYRIIPDKCVMCGLCRDACRHAAIHGEKKKPWAGGYPPFEIRQRRCVKCGDCVSVCPTSAIVVEEISSGKPVGV